MKTIRLAEIFKLPIHLLKLFMMDFNYPHRIFLYPFGRHFESQFVDEKISQFDWPTEETPIHGKQISVHAREQLLLKQTRATDLPLELALSYQTSLICGSKTRAQKFCCATYFFARNRWCKRDSLAPRACCRSVLREQAPSGLIKNVLLTFPGFW